MDLNFKEEDIEILDGMLSYLEEHIGGVLSMRNFIQDGFLPKNTTIQQYENYVCVLSAYGSGIRKGFGDVPSCVVSCKEIINFKHLGGFRGLFERKMKEEKEKNELTEAQKKNFELQNNELEYNRKTRWIAIIGVVLGFISAVISLFALL